MDYKSYIKSNDAIVGERFLAMIKNTNFSLSGLYLSLAEKPIIPSELPDLIDLLPQGSPSINSLPEFDKIRDTVEEVYSDSYPSAWIPVITTKSYEGLEVYVEKKLIPEEYNVSAEGSYTTWFLGYKNDLISSEEIYPCIYGYNTKEMIKAYFSNTICLPLDIKCNFTPLIPLESKYITNLEYNTMIEDVTDPLYYKSGELDNKVKLMGSYTLSPGVGKLENGVLKFK